jgi:hypothetical protein
MKEKGKTSVAESQFNSGEQVNQKPENRNRTEQVKLQEIGKKYIRIPHPVLKNTFILKEKK